MIRRRIRSTKFSATGAVGNEAQILATGVAVAVANSNLIDDNYFASPKRKDCKIDNGETFDPLEALNGASLTVEINQQKPPPQTRSRTKYGRCFDKIIGLPPATRSQTRTIDNYFRKAHGDKEEDMKNNLFSIDFDAQNSNSDDTPVFPSSTTQSPKKRNNNNNKETCNRVVSVSDSGTYSSSTSPGSASDSFDSSSNQSDTNLAAKSEIPPSKSKTKSQPEIPPQPLQVEYVFEINEDHGEIDDDDDDEDEDEDDDTNNSDIEDYIPGVVQGIDDDDNSYSQLFQSAGGLDFDLPSQSQNAYSSILNNIPLISPKRNTDSSKNLFLQEPVLSLNVDKTAAAQPSMFRFNNNAFGIEPPTFSTATSIFGSFNKIVSLNGPTTTSPNKNELNNMLTATTTATISSTVATTSTLSTIAITTATATTSSSTAATTLPSILATTSAAPIASTTTTTSSITTATTATTSTNSPVASPFLTPTKTPTKSKSKMSTKVYSEEQNSCESGVNFGTPLENHLQLTTAVSPAIAGIQAADSNECQSRRRKPATPHRILCPSPIKTAIVASHPMSGRKMTAGSNFNKDQQLLSRKSQRQLTSAASKTRRRLTHNDQKESKPQQQMPEPTVEQQIKQTSLMTSFKPLSEDMILPADMKIEHDTIMENIYSKYPTDDKMKKEKHEAYDDIAEIYHHSYINDKKLPTMPQNQESKDSITSNFAITNTTTGANKLIYHSHVKGSSSQSFKMKSPHAIRTATGGHGNRELTEFFPVRRSVRKTKTVVREEMLRNLEQAILDERAEGLQVAHFEGKGRGVIASRRFKRGEFVVEYIGDLISTAEASEREKKYALDENAGCYMYYFKHKNQQYCIDATIDTGKFGRLVNHSRNGNLVTKVVVVKSRPHLILLAKDDIEIGDELCYDYGDRSKESLLHHPWLAY